MKTNLNDLGVFSGLDSWLTQQLTGTRTTPEATAYVISVLKERLLERPQSLTGKSIVIAFANAREDGSFVGYQRLGDHVVFLGAVFPGSIECERDLIVDIGRLSYLACHRLLGHRWPVYQELADELPTLLVDIHRRLRR